MKKENNKNKYIIEKEKARNKAIEWQLEFSSKNYSYYDLMIQQEKFYKIAKRCGLIKEFRENGIL